MGRPLNSRNFGSNNTHSIQANAWTTFDTGSASAFIVKQNSDARFLAQTTAGESTCTLVGAPPTQSGQMTITITPVASESTGSGATAAAKMKVATATLASGGTGYVVNDVLHITGGAFTNVATITVNTIGANGVILTATLNTVANQAYTTLPAATAGVSDATTPAATGATFNLTFAVESVTVTAGGSNYTSATVSFSTSGSSASAVATATIVGGAVTAVPVTNGGTRYTGVPTVTINPPTSPFEYVKRLTSNRAITFAGNVYTWRPTGTVVTNTPTTTYGILDTL